MSTTVRDGIEDGESIGLGGVKRTWTSTTTDQGGQRKGFAELIRIYSARTKETFLFSGEHYQFLSRFLDQPSASPPWAKYTVENATSPGASTPSVYIHLNKGDPTPEIIPYDFDQSPEISMPPRFPSRQTSALVFIQGWQSRERLRVLAAHFKMDPELLRRHLIFLETRDFFDLPALPSGRRNIWTLKIATICRRRLALNPNEVLKYRETDLEDVKAYLNNLRAHDRSGLSIVRGCAILDETTWVIEQDISISVHRSKGGGWLGAVWLDSGPDFIANAAPSGLDLHHPNTLDPGEAAYDRFVPLIHHRDRIAIHPLILEPRTSAAAAASAPGQARQTTALIPQQYGSSLDSRISQADALYAFSELIGFAASSGSQLLNLLQAQVEGAIRGSGKQEEWSVSMLTYVRAVIDRHTDHFREVLHLLEEEGRLCWPRVSPVPSGAAAGAAGRDEASFSQASSSSQAPSNLPPLPSQEQSYRGGPGKDQTDWEVRESVRHQLVGDYRDLVRRGTALSGKAAEGVNMIRTGLMARSSENAFSLARQVGRISILAFFFLPMSFVTSVFGMNWVSLEQWTWGLAATLGALVIMMVVSYVVCFWETMPWTSLKTWIRDKRDQGASF